MNNIIKTILPIFILVFFVLPKLAVAQSVGNDCGVVISNGFEVQCKPWQKEFVYTDGICTYTICAALPDCILQPEDHWYYDDPKRLTRQQNDQAVTLPTGLAWSDAPGWNFDEMKNWVIATVFIIDKHKLQNFLAFTPILLKLITLTDN